MNIYTYFSTIRDAIHDDSATQTYCTGIWGRNHHIYVDSDEENPPSSSTEYPVVGMKMIDHTGGHAEDEETLRYEITTAIEIEGKKSGLKTNVEEHQGEEYIAEFTERVVDAIIGVVSAGNFIPSISRRFYDNNTYPIFRCTISLSITRPYAQGDALIP